MPYSGAVRHKVFHPIDQHSRIFNSLDDIVLDAQPYVLLTKK